jgi:hypothetical protein
MIARQVFYYMSLSLQLCMTPFIAKSRKCKPMFGDSKHMGDCLGVVRGRNCGGTGGTLG